MPRHVRNFWLDGTVDGRRSRLATGPRTKTGGFVLRIFQRDQGAVGTPLTLTGRTSADSVTVEITDDGICPGAVLYRRTTRR